MKRSIAYKLLHIYIYNYDIILYFDDMLRCWR